MSLLPNFLENVTIPQKVGGGGTGSVLTTIMPF